MVKLLVGLDFTLMTKYLKGKLINSFIRKIYYIKDRNCLLFSLYKKGVGNLNLHIFLNEGYSVLTKEKLLTQDQDNSFQQRLRKLISSREIVGINQLEFDRILIINL